MPQDYSINLGLGLTPETVDPELFNEAFKIYNAVKRVAQALDTYTGVLPIDSELWPTTTPAQSIRSQNTNKLYCVFGEDVSVGQFVTLYNDSGILKAKKAGGAVWAGDCVGFCSVVGGVLAGNYGEITLLGLHQYITGLTVGTLYYISNTTAGNITSTKPTTTGNRIQPVGYALSTTSLYFNPSTLVPLVDTGVLKP